MYVCVRERYSGVGPMRNDRFLLHNCRMSLTDLDRLICNRYRTLRIQPEVAKSTMEKPLGRNKAGSHEEGTTSTEHIKRVLCEDPNNPLLMITPVVLCIVNERW